ncbi:Ig-like domain-containing protein [Brevibacillus agri]|uniref:Ig-like domain-containing protein n=1 Tax=Brevibacillus agri TaxID=51101 RepID=UPI0025B6FD17|nr:Ig-like domain-containing protein [Brevibacillus agri]MDN4095219.1 Ig-like domain-containing protein [Brevibacillus agri]MED1826198.1 Ig-like domain-containing protein [Brevibacillus agri]
MSKKSTYLRRWQKALLTVVLTVGTILSGVGPAAELAKAETAASQSKKLSRLTVKEKTVRLKKDGTQQLTVLAQYADKTTEDVTQKAEWSTSDSGIVTVEAGLLRATGSGKADVKARFGGKFITISTEVDVVAKLVVDQKKLVLNAGAAKQIVATASFTDKSTAAVTANAEWTSADPEIATVANGLVTAVGSGKTKIKVVYGGKSVTIPVEVDVVSKLESDQKKLYARPGSLQAVKLTAVVNGKEKADVTAKAKWISDNGQVATVESGVVTVIGPGKAKITASYGGKTITIPVEAAVVSRLELSATRIQLTANESQQLQVFAIYSDKTKADVTAEAEWTSTDKNVASVAQGKVAAGTAGRATITASYGGKRVMIQAAVK